MLTTQKNEFVSDSDFAYYFSTSNYKTNSQRDEINFNKIKWRIILKKKQEHTLKKINNMITIK